MIELRNLSKRFVTADGPVDALKHVNLTVNDGDIYGIIGMSGAGKSTLVRCINMLERPTEGSVLLDGRDLGALGKKETKAHLGRLSKKLLVAGAALALIVIAVAAVLLHKERREAAQEQAEFLWQREGFARMDEYYDAGAYEDLVAFYDQAADEGHQVWQYRHWNFCEFYDLILTAQNSLQAWKAEGGSRLYLFYDEIKLYRLEYMNDLSPEERTMLDELRQPLLADFNERFPLTEAELDEFRRVLARDGFVPIKTCEQFFTERGWEE